MAVCLGAPERNTVDPLVSIVVPTLNEALNLSIVLPQLPKVHEVILVDGGSTDGTVVAARRVLPDVITVLQGREGKGNALAAGFARATGDIVVMFDADGSADPAEVTRFVEALKGGADFAKGSRLIRGGSSTGLSAIRHLGIRFLTRVFNLLFRARLTDLCYGFNAFWLDLVPSLSLPDHRAPAPGKDGMIWGDGFEIETVLSCRVAAAGLTVVEVPSMQKVRIFGESHLRVVHDGWRVLTTLVREWRRARSIHRVERRRARLDSPTPVAPRSRVAA